MNRMDNLHVVPRSTTDPLARIRAITPDLPEAQQRVADEIVADPDWTVRAAVEEIARRANVSAPTVVRFCRTLGYEGVSDFKLQLAQSLAIGTPYLHRAVTAQDDTSSLIHKILYGAAAVLTNLERQLEPHAVEQAIVKLATARRIECFSVGLVSTFLANDAQSRFARLGLDSATYFDAHMQLTAAAALTPRDVVLAISHVGRMPTLLEAVQLAREQGATVIAITQPRTPLAERCTIPLALIVPEDATMRVGTEAYLAGQVLIEMLMVGVGLRLGPAAIERLKRVHAVLLERGVDSDVHPALHRAWSESERDPGNE
ncbi:MAG TPA: MurR/RpiR family transcriptional regulator [Casimicrobiaceae bacterium]